MTLFFPWTNGTRTPEASVGEQWISLCVIFLSPPLFLIKTQSNASCIVYDSFTFYKYLVLVKPLFVLICSFCEGVKAPLAATRYKEKRKSLILKKKTKKHRPHAAEINCTIGFNRKINLEYSVKKFSGIFCTNLDFCNTGTSSKSVIRLVYSVVSFCWEFFPQKKFCNLQMSS